MEFKARGTMLFGADACVAYPSPARDEASDSLAAATVGAQPRDKENSR
jgi:hypothetical protein